MNHCSLSSEDRDRNSQVSITTGRNKNKVIKGCLNMGAEKPRNTLTRDCGLAFLDNLEGKCGQPGLCVPVTQSPVEAEGDITAPLGYT